MLSKKTDLQALQVEAEALASFLRTELRTFSKQHRPVELEPDAPAAAAVLWKAVGWSPVFEKSALEEPESGTGEVRIQHRLEDYRSWGDGFTLTGSDLPAKRRLVMDDGQGVGFAVTDERADEIDAPTLAVLADTNKVVPESKSYTRFCAHTMAECVFRRMYQTEIEIQPVGAIAAGGTKPWPLLLPGARQLTDDLYCEPPSAGAAQPQKQGKYKLAHRSVEALLTFLQTLEFEALTLYPPGDFLHLPSKLSELARDTDQLRPLPSLKPDEAYFVGTLGDVPVLVREEASRSRAYTNPRRLKDLQAVIDAWTQARTELAPAWSLGSHKQAMATEPDFEAFAALLREMSPKAKEYPPWVDHRPDLPERIRAFWRAVGVPPFRNEMLPKASKEEDEAVLAGVFERWFEDARTRDRWAVEPEDEPIPWRHLPPHPRVVENTAQNILVVSDVEPEPSLHLIRQTTPNALQLAFGHSYWCMRTVLVLATRENSVSDRLERPLASEPICPGLDIGVSRVSDGIYSIAPFSKNEGKWFVSRDIDTFTEFALALSPEERGYVGVPYGLRLEIHLSKKLDLDPTSKRIDSNFTPIYHQPPNPQLTRLVGRIEGHWVWVESDGSPRNVRVTCDASAEEAVKAWLEQGGAKITRTKVFARPWSSYW